MKLAPSYDANAKDIVLNGNGLIEFSYDIPNEALSRLTAIVGGYLFAPYGSKLSVLLGKRNTLSTNQITDIIKTALQPMVEQNRISGEIGLEVTLSTRAVEAKITIYPTNEEPQTLSWKGWI